VRVRMLEMWQRESIRARPLEEHRRVRHEKKGCQVSPQDRKVEQAVSQSGGPREGREEGRGKWPKP
jgi:hypothetical protein